MDGRWKREYERERTVIGGDFNARVGELGGEVRKKEDEGGRTSINKKVNKERKKLIGRIEESGCAIWNGDTVGDEEGEWTYIHRKAVGVDGIPAEVWKYSGERVREWVWRFCSRIWKGEGWIEEWKEEVIVPVLKKGEGRKVEKYKGVTLTPSLYKVYAAVLAERLREEVRT